MQSKRDDRRTSAVAAGRGAAAVFEVLTVPEAQDRAAWAASAWKEDPYHTVVSLAAFAVAVLALAVAVRLLARRAPGGQDRARQTARATGAMTALIGLTLVFEWAAFIRRENASSWGTWTSVQIGGLVVVSACTVVATVLLARPRGRHGSPGWRHDWLDDLVFLCRTVPLLRRWAGPRAADRVRRHATTVFLALSVLVAATVTAPQAIGERITDPLLVSWMLVAVTAATFAFCVIGNAVAGFVARPPRTRPHRIAEASVVAGCVAIPVAIAFHGPLWSTVATAPLTPPELAALTLGAGLATALVATAVLIAHTLRSGRAGPGDAATGGAE